MATWSTTLLNEAVDVSRAFGQVENTFYAAQELVQYDAKAGKGLLKWSRYGPRKDIQFNQSEVDWVEEESNEFPPVYIEAPALPLWLSFVSEATVRLRIWANEGTDQGDQSSPMLVGPVPSSPSWQQQSEKDKVTYTSERGSVVIHYSPFRIEFFDQGGRLLFRTKHIDERWSFQRNAPIPFSFVRRADTLERHLAATFTSAPGERIYGCGESFTALNKRGQKVVLWTRDAKGVQLGSMYKPVPFFLSSRGYGVFVHTSAPLTFDFGYSYDGVNTIFTGSDLLDIFVFLGSPQEVLSEYTAITGRSSMPPLWSFGLWMSRITYNSEKQVREVAGKLREHRIPCDVIHIDTGWFSKDWCCDYEFDPDRFPNPEAMIADLRKMGFRISLWQLPYFTPANKLYQEAIERGYIVRDPDGGLPTEDAIIDFSNPEAVAWYQRLLARLLKMGAGAIKVDFGEGAPLHGQYASGRSGFYEHNLYPLRYNKAAFEVTRQVTGDNIIWARSAWAGSQRYPLHWGGDAETTDSGMAATLRGGLSFGLCGFSFWSHDIGGFVSPTPKELYRRWLPFGLLSSHSRCHGAPPTEPWHYDDEFVTEFRRAVELRYRLLPYIYAQAKLCSERGHPLMQPLFFQFPEDNTAWLVEDEYFFGSDLLMAPLFESGQGGRPVYVPEGWWIDYQTGRAYEGGKWHEIEAGEVPIVLLVKDGSVLPHVALAQSTEEIDWTEIELRFFHVREEGGEALLFLPGEEHLWWIPISLDEGRLRLVEDPLQGAVRWRLVSVLGE